MPRRSRTASVTEAIQEDVLHGEVTYFCKSKGHGFIKDEHDDQEHFVHVSDIESDFVPMQGDKVSYKLCPIPPKFEKCQAVHVQIVKMSPTNHKR